MKKTGLIFSLLFALTATCLTGCDVSKKKEDGKQVLFTIGDTKITADDLLGFGNDTKELSYDLLSTDEGVNAVYNSVLGALAKANVTRDAVIDQAVENRMEAFDESVEEYASTNGVTKRSAQETKLEELGLSSKEELKEKYYVEEQIAELLEKYEDDMQEFVDGEDYSKSLVGEWVNNTHPMVVKHILTKVSDASTIYSKGLITESEVLNLVTVLQRLATKDNAANNFKSIAMDESEDTSNTKGGSVGIVDTYTSFVNEFKLALYAQKIVEAPSEKQSELADAYGVNKVDVLDEYEEFESVNILAIGSVLAGLYEEQNKLEQEANTNKKESEYDAQIYPRNRVYNKYLNTPVAKYIFVSLENLDNEIENVLDVAFPNNGKLESSVYDTQRAEYLAKIKDSSFYKAVTKDGALTTELNANNILLENEYPLLLAKSSYGFHFISADWDSMAQEGNDAIKYFMYGSNAASSGTYATISDYTGYSTLSTAKTQRKNEIADRIENYMAGGFGSLNHNDSLVEYKAFRYFYEKTPSCHVSSEKIEAALNKLIDNAIEVKANDIKEANQEAWDAYFEQLQAYHEMASFLGY